MTVVALTRKTLRSFPLPMPNQDGSKRHRGKVLVVAGSRAVPGAALLSGVSALRAGAGVLQISTSESVAAAIGVAIPEAMVIGLSETVDGGIDPSNSEKLLQFAADADSILIGPGMVNDDAVAELTMRLVDGASCPTILLDARACSSTSAHLRNLKKHTGKVVLTPHAGEMAKLLGLDRSEVEADMLAAAKQASSDTGAVVAMKGAETYVVDPTGNAWLVEGGSISLATSGSGDTLAGIIAGLLARGAEATRATLWGVYMHAEAGRRLSAKYGPLGALAREIPSEIPFIMRHLSDQER